jgi:hypothetical protein
VFEAERDVGEQVADQRALAEGVDELAGNIGPGHTLALSQARNDRLGPILVALLSEEQQNLASREAYFVRPSVDAVS